MQFTSLASALTSIFGQDVSITRTDRLSGGDINKAYGLTLADGSHVFMKANAKKNASFFTAEAEGLYAIASTKTIATPKILCTGTDDGEQVGYSFLLLEFIEGAAKRRDYWETFAHELSELHKASTEPLLSGGRFGFASDNFIGARGQKNTPHDNWIDFFRDERLLPQFMAAEKYFDQKDQEKIQKLVDHLDDFLLKDEKPSLIHGDLWSGNVITGADGKAWLIDPAAYVGSAEADIAMTELFGGFPEVFYETYKDEAKMQAGYEDRRDLYNLYQLLNHLNMFGAGYLEAVKSIVSEYID